MEAKREEAQELVKELQRVGLEDVLWCGGANRGQDVTVRLVRAAGEEDERLETLAMVKAHASHLMQCSKYFETCLSERWRERGSDQGGVELSLEVVHADVGCYTDCFSRMYTSRKEFRSVKYSLELLKVASQVEYHELMDQVSLYLSAVSWSEEDERRIREYAASPDFSRSHLEELVLRLGLKEDQQRKVGKQTWDVTFWGITNALDFRASPSFRKFVEELLEGNQVGTVNLVIVHAAKSKLVEFEKECQEVGRFMKVENFDKHVLGICWIMRLLLAAGVAEELVQCLLTLRTIPLYLVDAAECEEAWDEANAGCEFAQVVLQMYREVVAGRLLLKATERVALLENWHELVQSYLFDHEDTSKATKELFLTLPAEDQVRLLNLQEASYSSFKFIDPRSLAAVVKKNCLVVDGNNLHVMTEVNPRQQSEHVSSDNFGDDDSRASANAKRRKQRRNRRSQ